MSLIVRKLESIVGASALCAWEDLPIASQSQIQLATTAPPACVVYPQSQAELAAIVTCAHQNRWRMLPCGSGSKLHWGGLAKGIDLVVSLARLNRLVEHAVGDLTVTAEAGMQFGDLQAILAAEGQFLAIDPAFAATTTLGGIVATADTGSLRQRYGGVRDMLIGLSFVRSDGQIAHAGGRVVKNVAGYDLMKLFTGSWGTLGIIDQVTFRIYPIASASQTVVLTGAADAIAQATQTLLASALTPIAVDLIAPQTASRLNLGNAIGLIAQFRSIEVSVEEQANALIEVGKTLNLKTARFADRDEADLWQRFKQPIEATQTGAIACKIGVLPSEAVAILSQISAIVPLQIGFIHASSGLGMLRFEEVGSDRLLKLRDLCQVAGGFLTILEAPSPLKSRLDLWGYPGNALPLMKRIKQQFDPQNLLSPDRFLSGI